MLYKFKSKATADLIMLEPNGKQILRIIGKEPAIKGIVEVAEMPQCIEALRRAVQLEEDTQAQMHAQNAQIAAAHDRPVSLRQRAAPFIEMLQRAHKAGKDVVWGA
jgi:cyclopropane-fatty-acyl-phospholipid synthase